MKFKINKYISGLNRDIGAGVILRVLAMLSTFVSMPLMLNIVEQKLLGIWFTIISILQWVNLFDFGITAGLRNKIARLRVQNKLDLVRGIVAEGYASLFLIVFTLVTILIVLVGLVPIEKIFKVDEWNAIIVHNVLVISFIVFGLNLVLNFSAHIFSAFERPLYQSLSVFITNLVFLIGNVVMNMFSYKGMYGLVFIYATSVLLGTGFVTYSLFNKYKSIRFSISDFKPRLAKDARNFGLQIFVIQLSVLLVFTATRLMISILISPEEVVVYESAYKLIAIPLLVHSIVMNGLWSSFTRAHELSDWLWIERKLFLLIKLMLIVVIAAFVYSISAPWFISFWMGSNVVASNGVYTLLAIFMVITCWNNIFAYFVNGVGIVKPQMYCAVVNLIISIPLTYSLVNYFHLGMQGVILSSIISLSFFAIVGPLQVYKFVKTRVIL